MDSSDTEDIDIPSQLDDITLEMDNMSIDFSELKEFEATKKPKRRRKKGKPHRQEDPSSSMAKISDKDLTIPENLFSKSSV